MSHTTTLPPHPLHYMHLYPQSSPDGLVNLATTTPPTPPRVPPSILSLPDLLAAASCNKIPEVVVPPASTHNRMTLLGTSCLRALRAAGYIQRDPNDDNSHLADDVLISAAAVAWWVESRGTVLPFDSLTTSDRVQKGRALTLHPRARSALGFPPDKTIFDYSTWLLACHVATDGGLCEHFWLVEVKVTPREGRATVYDSASTSLNSDHQAALDVVQSTLHEGGRRLAHASLARAPQQASGSNLCGYYVAEFGRRISKGGRVGRAAVDVRSTVDWMLGTVIALNSNPLA